MNGIKVTYNLQKGVMAFYNRELAVEYSRKWWNKRNPNFPQFQNDCTNFISQCLLAGGIPMKHSSNVSEGWWYNHSTKRWSLSWSVSHSLRWYLLNKKLATQVSDVSLLKVGDLIFLDFQGDGRIDHCTIVNSTGVFGVTVNAHTSDSYNRNYLYQDSTAYTENMRYHFLTIH